MLRVKWHRPKNTKFLVLLVLTLKLELGHHHLVRYLQRVPARTELPSVEEIQGMMADHNSQFISLDLVALKLNEFWRKGTKMICSCSIVSYIKSNKGYTFWRLVSAHEAKKNPKCNDDTGFSVFLTKSHFTKPSIWATVHPSLSISPSSSFGLSHALSRMSGWASLTPL